MKLAVFGSTGLTGLQLVEQGLARGHQVTAFVRAPEKLSQFNSNSNFKVQVFFLLLNDIISIIFNHKII